MNKYIWSLDYSSLESMRYEIVRMNLCLACMKGGGKGRVMHVQRYLVSDNDD